MIAFPYFVFFEMLSPLVELLGYVIIPLSYALGMVNFLFFALFLVVAILVGVILSPNKRLLASTQYLILLVKTIYRQKYRRAYE